MATVYKVRDTARGGSVVAIKILNQELARDPVVVERFNREARAAQRIAHPNLVPVYDCGTTSAGTPYLVMEFVDGTDLSEIIKSEGHLTVARSVNIFMQLCYVLRKAHETGLVHRDIKPSNILVCRDENREEVVKLTDFGIAKPPRSERAMNPALTHTGSILGSPAYMSPEQAMGESVDERSDIYSLGCVMYETLTGRSPFAADTPVKSIIKHIEQSAEPFEIEFKHLEIPRALEETVLKCLYKKPARRFQRIYQLEHALTSLPITGIYRRLLSHCIDAGIVLLGASLVGNMPSHFRSDSTALPYLLMSTFICLYYALFESSKLQATPGKMLTGLKTYDCRGGRLSAFAVMACVSAILCCVAMIVLLCVAFFNLTFLFSHPFSSEITWATFLIIWFTIINGLPSAYNHGRQDLFDMMFGRIITKPYYSSANPAKPRSGLEYVLMTAVFLIMPFLSVEIIVGFLRGFEAVGPRPVVVATKHIDKGTTITADMLKVIHSFPSLVAPRFIDSPNALIGHRASRDIQDQDPLTEKSVDPDGSSIEP
jgi:serine/threonine protein kinase